MYGSAIPRVMSKHPGPQPSPEISHCDCAGVECTQKKAWRPLDGGLELRLRRSSGRFFRVSTCLQGKYKPFKWSLLFFVSNGGRGNSKTLRLLNFFPSF